MSGLAALLAMLALTLLQAASAGRGSAAARCAAARARLCAESGMDYAAVRLVERPFPERRDASARGDDWTCRRGPENPSYSHGNGWIDDGDGLYEAGEPSADRGGAFSAWSGRLRGGRGDRSTAFSLKVESLGGKIPLNAGFLDAQDRNGGGAMDHQDLSIPFHAGLAHALNNLGASLLPAAHPRFLLVPTENPREIFRYSRLGDDLVSLRPIGGYRSWQDALRRLAPLGYSAADLSLLAPYVELSPPEAAPQNGPSWSTKWQTSDPFFVDRSHTPAAAVELSTAARPVLEALFRYLCCSNAAFSRSCELGAEAQRYPRTLPSSFFVYAYLYNLIIWPDEAERLAGFAIRHRESSPGGVPRWKDLYQLWMDHADSSDLDPYAPGAPSDGNIVISGINVDPSRGPAFPNSSLQYCQQKIDLAFAAVCEHPFYGYHIFGDGGLLAWRSLGVTRKRWVPAPPPGRYVDLLRPCGVHSHPAFTPKLGRIQPSPTCWSYLLNSSMRVTIAPLGLTTRPPSRFSIGSTVRADRASCSVSGCLRTAETLFLTSQEDFENAAGSAELRTALGISAVNDDVFGRSVRLDSGRQIPEVATLPCWPRGSWPREIPPPSVSSYYPRREGGISLGVREGGLHGADLYFPFSETDGDSPAGFSAESAVDPTPPRWWDSGPLDPKYTLTAIDRARFNAFNVAGACRLDEGTNPEIPAGCPGMASGKPILASFEGWSFVIGPGKEYPTLLMRVTSGLFKAEIYAGHNDIAETTFLEVHGAVDLRLSVPDEPGGPWAHHFCLVIEPASTDPASGTQMDRTRITLRIDGGGASRTVSGFCTTTPQGESMRLGGTTEWIWIEAVDDLRIYARALSEAETMQAWREGRYLRRGAYTSPLYATDEPVKLGWAQWIGCTSPFWKDAAGKTVDPFTVEVLAYDAPDGTERARSVVLGPSEAVGALAALGTARSFRYRVTFDMDRAVNVPVLADTPVFESIWLTFRRRGMPPWSAWAAH